MYLKIDLIKNIFHIVMLLNVVEMKVWYLIVLSRINNIKWPIRLSISKFYNENKKYLPIIGAVDD